MVLVTAIESTKIMAKYRDVISFAIVTAIMESFSNDHYNGCKTATVL